MHSARRSDLVEAPFNVNHFHKREKASGSENPSYRHKTFLERKQNTRWRDEKPQG
jgi:hypothetical protein